MFEETYANQDTLALEVDIGDGELAGEGHGGAFWSLHKESAARLVASGAIESNWRRV